MNDFSEWMERDMVLVLAALRTSESGFFTFVLVRIFGMSSTVRHDGFDYELKKYKGVDYFIGRTPAIGGSNE